MPSLFVCLQLQLTIGADGRDAQNKLTATDVTGREVEQVELSGLFYRLECGGRAKLKASVYSRSNAGASSASSKRIV